MNDGKVTTNLEMCGIPLHVFVCLLMVLFAVRLFKPLRLFMCVCVNTAISLLFFFFSTEAIGLQRNIKMQTTAV